MTSLLDLPAVSGCYLFPQSRTVRKAWMVPVDGAELACVHHVIDPARLTLIHFHGNGEAVADYVPWMAEELAAQGLNSLFVEYRGYGASTGEAQLVAMLGDGEAVMKAAGLTPERVIAFGRSIGSLYAIELVHRQPTTAGLILESGIAEPAERFLKYADLRGTELTPQDVMDEARRHFHHRQKLSGYRGPALLLHTVNDGMVEISHAERNLEWLAGDQKKLIRFSAGDHNRIMECNAQAYFDEIGEFVKLLEIG
ncbi:alpha/beta hydrolase [Schlesneria sp.]|uniref:alpha/beta hydrolase n=1 Tax=Schlesneria sp. TaxID=2762018 RepID=UPI002F07C654